MSKQLEQLATTLVGDGKKPNLFFLTKASKVVTITTNQAQAELLFKGMKTSKQLVVIEDRLTGWIKSNQE